MAEFASALNLAIENSKGEYISWLSHDDVYYPNKIQEQIETLSKLEDKNTFIYSNSEYINEKGGSYIRLTMNTKKLVFY